jgi:hypothetical protein
MLLHIFSSIFSIVINMEYDFNVSELLEKRAIFLVFLVISKRRHLEKQFLHNNHQNPFVTNS